MNKMWTCPLNLFIFYKNIINKTEGRKRIIMSKHKKVQTNAYFDTDTQYANFRGNPLYQATKRHLNNR